MASEPERFATAIAALASGFGREVDSAALLAYELGLKGLPVEAIEHAVQRALQLERFMPPPARLRELGGEVSAAIRAVQAWDCFRKAIGRHGYYHSVSFVDDPILNATIRNLGGWQRVSELRDNRREFETFFRKEFERVYVALCQSGVTADQAAPLPGYCETQNALHGHDRTELVRIETGLPPAPIGIAGAPRKSIGRSAGPQRIGQVLATNNGGHAVEDS